MKIRFLVIVVGSWLGLSLLISVPANAGLGDAYLNACRRLLYKVGWMNQVSLSENSPYWVKDAKELMPVSDALVDAFSQDPLFTWVAPNPKIRRKLIYTLVRHAYMNGGVLTTNPPGTAAALWFESNRASAGPLSIFLTGQAPLIPRVGLLHTFDVLKLDEFMIRTRKRILSEVNARGNAIYLYMIGVRENARGQGLASQLIRPILQYADSTGQVILLETHKQENILMYQHLGFEIRSQETVPDDAPMTTSMLRMPNEAPSPQGIISPLNQP